MSWWEKNGVSQPICPNGLALNRSAGRCFQSFTLSRSVKLSKSTFQQYCAPGETLEYKADVHSWLLFLTPRLSFEESKGQPMCKPNTGVPLAKHCTNIAPSEREIFQEKCFAVLENKMHMCWEKNDRFFHMVSRKWNFGCANEPKNKMWTLMWTTKLWVHRWNQAILRIIILRIVTKQ